MDKVTAAITAVGKYVPDYILTNKELETMVETNDDWITSRTGIKERRILKEEEGKGTSYLAIKSAEDLIAKSNLDPSEIEMVILCTATPDMQAASTGAFVANKIGAVNAFAFDLEAACSSFLYGLSVAAGYIESGRYKKILLIGADMNSSMIDYTDRTTCIIFGDGAGAVLVEPTTDGNGLQDEIMRSDGSGREFLNVAAGGSMMPATEETVKERLHFARQDGQTVFKNAVFNMADVCEKILEKNNISNDDVDWLAAHQANKRIVEATARRMKLDSSKVMLNIAKYGNTTSATLPLLLADYEKQLKKGDTVILAAFGGGFSWGSIYFKWCYNS
ncbi:beta-ketoacyl-ACP synthase III [Lutimonas halocynthiae]|uniref:beta-ketoacyl-ACP synthase III n=1 Tax=Lutimonas halocynthiae TaxID=1446477 RepID=UPI0025B3960B|nr:beta-ketoacyl-ACP synthase III [Lutimonas halocynthiae]MDN3643118.1 beta-ketoacyl-ACP synthase III [Lutimonas halocynthiae]